MTYRFSVDISSVFLVGEPMGVTDEASSDTLGKKKENNKWRNFPPKKKTVFSLGMFGKIGKREREKEKETR